MYQVLLFSPEMTTTDEYSVFIHDRVAQLQIGCFVVDKIHLVYEWVPSFVLCMKLPSSLMETAPSSVTNLSSVHTMTDEVKKTQGQNGQIL